MKERLGVGVVIVRDGDVLFGRRLGAHGAGTWSFPGGHLAAGEDVKACALRELYEETGLEGKSPRIVAESLDDFPEGLRYRTLFVRVDYAGGEPLVREPEACDGWVWHAWDAAPQPLFLPVASLRAAGFDPIHPTGLGVVEAIHIAPAAGVPTNEVGEVHAQAGIGLDGDRYAVRKGYYTDSRVSRDLTLVEAEVIEDLAREQGIELSPGEIRRNITTRGIRLNDLVGHRFRIGEVLCEGTRLCEPCQYLADLTGKPLLVPMVHRGGLRADILRGGRIRKGDAVELVA